MFDLTSLFSAQNLLQSAAVGIAVYIVRLWCEAKWVTLAQNKLWTGVCLQSLALAVSCLTSFLLPVVGSAVRDTVLTALLNGFMSGYIFSALKAFLTREADK